MLVRLRSSFACGALAVLFLFVMPSLAKADAVTWRLFNVTFPDGGTASGSFSFDALTDTVSAVDITTTAGNSFGGATYTAVDPGYAPNRQAMVFVTSPYLADLTGTPALDLTFATLLTNLGGTFQVTVGEDYCFDALCHNGGNLQYGTGFVTTAPEPSSLLLFAAGVTCMALWFWRRRFAESPA
jgi:hypothetical protein